jgi:glyoxylase-like metal-dependent hydrolase (beta-lactamase superfamily II)
MDLVHRLAAGTTWIDLQFLGKPHRIASCLLHGSGGAAIVDPGPTTCLPTLERALAALGTPLEAVTHLVLTHIHLDHAGAAGVIVRRHPHIRVVVHRKGAPHLVDPARLLDSAGRLYGAEMDRLWGACNPVPESHLAIVDGGERLNLAGRDIEVAYTPGHASHHVSYFETATGISWVGDTAGVCVEGGYVLPPTPPPDIDLPAWEDSLQRIGAWHPDTLFLTHCGPVTQARVHLRTLSENLRRMADWVREGLASEADDASRRQEFERRVRRDLRRHMSEERAEAYETAAGFGLLWQGLARYWRRQAPGGAAGRASLDEGGALD